MYTPVNVIQVYAWGEFVGALALDPRLGFYAFEYDPRWLRTGRELAPLQMPGRASPYVFPSLPVETFQRLPALLRAGHLRALAVTTAQRSSVLPQVPTMEEAGVKGYQVSA